MKHVKCVYILTGSEKFGAHTVGMRFLGWVIAGRLSLLRLTYSSTRFQKRKSPVSRQGILVLERSVMLVTLTIAQATCYSYRLSTALYNKANKLPVL